MARLKPLPETHAYGLAHFTCEEISRGNWRKVRGDGSKEDDWARRWEKQRVNDVVSRLFTQLREDKVQKLGVEWRHDDVQFDPHNPIHRFWKAVALRARRAEIELVPLAQDPSVLEINRLHGMMSEAAEMTTADRRRRKDPETSLRMAFVNIMLGSLHQLELGSMADSRLIEATRAYCLQHQIFDLRQVTDALTYSHTLRMHETALREGVLHQAIGASHADDLESGRLAQVKYFLDPEAHEKDWHARTPRRRAYHKLQPLMAELWRIAEELHPAREQRMQQA